MNVEPIRTVAAVITNEAGQVLLVRKRGTQVFIQPGGKREPDEDSLATLDRELFEELGVRIKPATVRRLGEFEDNAVNEPGRRVRAEVFVVEISGPVAPQAEIEEAAWVYPGQTNEVPVAPLSRWHVLPAFVRFREQAGGGD